MGKIKLSPSVAKYFYNNILETIETNLSIHEAMYQEKDGSWSIEFYASPLVGEIEIVGNAYLSEPVAVQAKELVRIEGALEKELSEALVSENEVIREAAQDRMVTLKRKRGCIHQQSTQ